MFQAKAKLYYAIIAAYANWRQRLSTFGGGIFAVAAL